MSLPSERENPPANVPRQALSSSLLSLRQHAPGRDDTAQITEFGTRTQSAFTLRHPPSIHYQNPLGTSLGDPRISAPARRSWLKPHCITNGYEFLITTAGIALPVQIELLTSDSITTTTTTRGILTLATISELLGIIIALYFLRFYKHTKEILLYEPLPVVILFMSSMPILLISMGLVGLAAVLVMEAFTV